MNRRFACLWALLSTCSFLVGCGGHRDAPSPALPQPPTGQVRLAIHWPERARLIPQAANSVKVDLSNAAGFAASRVVDRPAEGGFSTVAFADLPVGDLTVAATAYPQAGAAGTAQAAATMVLTILGGQEAQAGISMESTIARVLLNNDTPNVSKHDSLPLVATPVDASGAAVPVALDGIAWIADDPDVAAVDQAGVLTGIKAGVATIVAVERESGLYAVATVTVTNKPNRAPVAVDDSVESAPGVPITIAVLANDSDPDGDPLSLVGVTDPPDGAAAANADGTLTYQPDAGFKGKESFFYTVDDGRGGTDIATVDVRVR